MLFSDDVFECRQHHSHAGLWPYDRPWGAACCRTVQRFGFANRECGGVSCENCRHWQISYVCGRSRYHRLSHASRTRRTSGTQDRPRDRRGFDNSWQDRHAHEPRLRRGRLHRCQQRHRFPGASRDVRGGGKRARCDSYLSPPICACGEPIQFTAQQPFRRAGCTDVAR